MAKPGLDEHVRAALLGLMLAVILLTGLARMLVRRSLRPSALRVFTAELLATFQICCCSHELQVLSDFGPSNPSWTLTLLYFFSLLHGFTLVGGVSNPCEVLEQLALESLPLATSFAKVVAQMVSSALCRSWMMWVWSLDFSKKHTPQRTERCAHPMRIALPEAFLVEMVCSFISHSTLMHFQDMRLKFRIHLQAALVTFLVFAGGNFTGAIFNPALALSLHFQCFREFFYNYFTVYCLAPSLGIMLMVLMFDHFLPWLYKMNRIPKNAQCLSKTNTKFTCSPTGHEEVTQVQSLHGLNASCTFVQITDFFEDAVLQFPSLRHLKNKCEIEVSCLKTFSFE